MNECRGAPPATVRPARSHTLSVFSAHNEGALLERRHHEDAGRSGGDVQRKTLIGRVHQLVKNRMSRVDTRIDLRHIFRHGQTAEAGCKKSCRKKLLHVILSFVKDLRPRRDTIDTTPISCPWLYSQERSTINGLRACCGEAPSLTQKRVTSVMRVTCSQFWLRRAQAGVWPASALKIIVQIARVAPRRS